MIVLTNGTIATPEEMLTGFDLVIDGSHIASVDRTGTTSAVGNEIVDVGGAFVLPGLIDVHSDYIEHMAAPRPTSMMDFSFALREAERELISHGITTMYHSLSIYDYTEFSHLPIRSVENTRKLIDVIDRTHASEHFIHHRFHARFEIDNVNRVEELREYIREGKVHLLSFMDHTPGQGQYRNLEIYRETLKGYRNLSDDEVDRVIAHSQGREKLTVETLRSLAREARACGIAVASHDDDSVEKLDLISDFDASISEFPITLEVALAARSRGLHTVAGAPNILLGGSHSGNLSAAEAILADAVDVLCSDYYPAALLKAVFVMHRQQGRPLHEMVRLVTHNPAAAVQVDDHVGSLTPGKRADVVVVDVLDDQSPAVARAYVAGAHVYSAAYRR